jgi:hypothetical protein
MSPHFAKTSKIANQLLVLSLCLCLKNNSCAAVATSQKETPIPVPFLKARKRVPRRASVSPPQDAIHACCLLPRADLRAKSHNCLLVAIVRSAD